MVRRRHAHLGALGALIACVCLVGAPAVAARASRVASYTLSSGQRKHHPHSACGARRASRHPARRASFHGGSRSKRHGAARCPRHHRAARGRNVAHQRAPAAAHSSVCTNADLMPTATNLDLIDAATLCLVNRERAGQGEAALRLDAALACAAQSHSDDMAAADYFDHVGPRGDTPVSRMRACRYINNPSVGYEVGENIAWGTLWLATPRAIVAAWMASPGHRANILDSRYRDTAIGVSPHPLASLAHGQAGAMYTQDFGVIGS